MNLPPPLWLHAWVCCGFPRVIVCTPEAGLCTTYVVQLTLSSDELSSFDYPPFKYDKHVADDTKQSKTIPAFYFMI